jgi:quercetin 2,3-dioxygenase
VRRAGERFGTDVPGLSTRHSFSFGMHYDPDNVGFEALMAHNEERIEVARGYDDHPHRDAEIVTWVLSGALLHADSAGNSGLVRPRLAQRMSAGSGIVHAERNDGYRIDPNVPRVPVHFVQMWLRPDVSGAPPSYQQAEVSEAALAADWVPVVSGAEPDRAVGLGTSAATLWVTTAGPGERRVLPEAAAAHLYVARGEVQIESAGRLGTGDALRIRGPAALAVTATTDTELLVWTFAS